MYHPLFCVGKNGMPFVKKKKIDNIAQNYVQDFCPDALKTPQALDVEKFIEYYLGLNLDYRSLSADKEVLGMTVFCDTTFAPMGTIIISKELAENKRQQHRCRFTLAHECGHWIFHKKYYNYNPDQLELFVGECERACFTECRVVNQKDERNTLQWTDERWREWHADKFASAFLMPNMAVDILRERFGKEFSSCEIISEFLEKMVDVFDVSAQAAYFRLCDLKYVNDDSIDERQISLLQVEK